MAGRHTRVILIVAGGAAALAAACLLALAALSPGIALPGAVRGTPSPDLATQFGVAAGGVFTSEEFNSAFPAEAGNTELAVRADAYLSDLARRGQFAGTVLLADHGRVLFARGYGMADYANDVPNNVRTRYRIGALTRPFTALAILALQGQGKLTIDDALCGYLPDCAPAWKNVTIRQALDLSAQLPRLDDFVRETRPARLPAPPGDIVAFLRARGTPTANRLVSLFPYDDPGYILLGYVIEKASGQSYDAFLQRNVLDPLRLYDTGYALDREVVPRQAYGYFTPAERARETDMGLAWSAGGLYSTVGDLLAWDQALYGNDLVPKQALYEMFTGNALNNGFGWQVSDRPFGHVVEARAQLDGYGAYLGRYTSSKTTVIVLSNLETSPVDAIRARLTSLVFSER
jgi:CubicO group peptidase (beta-lactamase class C family)